MPSNESIPTIETQLEEELWFSKDKKNSIVSSKKLSFLFPSRKWFLQKMCFSKNLSKGDLCSLSDMEHFSTTQVVGHSSLAYAE